MRNPFGRPDLRAYAAMEQPATEGAGLTAWFLGTSSVLLSDGDTAVLSDGFVTRPGLARVLLGKIAPDEQRIQQAIDRLGANVAAVVCAHSHYDHALDAPVWAAKTGADLVGSESTANIGRGWGVPEEKLKVAAGKVTYGRFELTFVQSVHSHGDQFPGTVDAPLVPPARARRWRTGECYSIFIKHPTGTILLHASSNYVSGALHGTKADVVYLGVGALGKQPDEFIDAYWREVVRATGARRVVLVHWDNFFTPLDEPLRPLPYLVDDLDRTISRLTRLADGVEIVLPVAWRPADPFA